MRTNDSSSFNPHYLKYLALTGSTNLHAAAAAGTEKLRSALALQPGNRVLEIGCGTGATMLKFASESKVQVDGVDILQEMLEVARVRLRAAGLGNALVHADATVALPFRNEAYDSVFTESVLGIHSPESAESFLREVWRVLKVGGRFVANEGVWKAGTAPEIVAEIDQACREDFGFSFASCAGWSKDDWRLCMKRAGFTDVRTQVLDLHDSASIAASRNHRVSQFVTLAFRLKAFLNHRLDGHHRQYQKLLDRHRNDHKHIEAHLFEAIKR